MENAEGKWCGRCAQRRPVSAFGTRKAAKDGLQHWCRECFADRASERRPRKMAVVPSVPGGHKWCRRCGETKPADDFANHKSRPDRRQVHCRACQAADYRRRQEAAGNVVRPPDIPEGHKFCRGCQRILPLSDWARRARSTDGYAFRCRGCISAHDREKALVAKYGMTSAEVEAMCEAQGGVCAICRTAPAVHVDHDHRTGEVRGMLCFSCNAALGHFTDDPEVLRRAADYLERAAPPVHVSRRDETAWAAVLALFPTGGPSRVEEAFRVRLAELGVGPAS